MNATKLLSRPFLTLVFMAAFQAIIYAQGEGGSTNVVKTTTTTTSNWYAQPWVWVVGVAVFILLLIALLRGGSSTDRSEKVVVTKTTNSDL